MQQNLYQNISKVIQDAKQKTVLVVNFAMVEAYWLIGKYIVEDEQDGEKRAKYGEQQISELAKKLSKEFGSGFDRSNLLRMKNFFLLFPIRDALRHELSWTHYRLLLKVQSEKARAFYIKEAIEQQWGTRSLERQINSFYYERLLSSKNPKPVIEEMELQTEKLQPEDVLKDPFVLEFLGAKENHSWVEKELEAALIDKLQDFLLELGKGFSFVARQKRISAEEEHFYIDLVFYNYLLKCFVLIDLKTSKLTHQDIGQMDFYVRFWEDKFKTEGDNPTIGIILCSEKNQVVAKYSVLENNRQLFASKYMLHLPTEEELQLELEREKYLIEMEKIKNEK